MLPVFEPVASESKLKQRLSIKCIETMMRENKIEPFSIE